jgi:hypothetical protein
MFSDLVSMSTEQRGGLHTESDVVRPVSVAPISVLQPAEEGASTLGVVLGSIDVVVLVQDISRVDDNRCPELGLNHRPVQYLDILRICNSERHGSGRQLNIGQAVRDRILTVHTCCLRPWPIRTIPAHFRRSHLCRYRPKYNSRLQ